MKKFLIFLMLFILIGCTAPIEPVEPDNPPVPVDEVEINADSVGFNNDNVGKTFDYYESFLNTPPGEPRVLSGKTADNENLTNYLFDELLVKYTPTFIIVDDEGVIRYYDDGELTHRGFDNILSIIGEEENSKILCFEIFATTCSHCRNQLINQTPLMLEKHPEVIYVHYFIVDYKEDIDEFIGKTSVAAEEATEVNAG